MKFKILIHHPSLCFGYTLKIKYRRSLMIFTIFSLTSGNLKTSQNSLSFLNFHFDFAIFLNW